MVYADELHPRRQADFLAGRLAAQKALHQAGAGVLAMCGLLPKWRDPEHGGATVATADTCMRIELTSRVVGERMWVIASVADGKAIGCSPSSLGEPPQDASSKK